MKKHFRLLVFLVAGLIQTNSLVISASENNEITNGLSVEIVVRGQLVTHNDPANPIMLNAPVAIPVGGNPHGYVAVITNPTGRNILPFSIYRNGEVAFMTPRTGTYGIINNTTVFTDTTGHWAENNITFASARELFRGVGDNRFDPNAPMTRAMFVQVLANLDNANLTAFNTSRFADVPTDAWYMRAVEWAAATGLVSGVGDGNFDPNANITREQMARMLVNYIEYKTIELPASGLSVFNDAAYINEWAISAINTLNGAGIIAGRTGNIFEPQGIATRAEVATVFTRFITVYINHNM